jgi:preprotein translocase subunit SecD
LGVAIETFQVTSGIDEAKALIGQTALLEFKERTCLDPLCIEYQDSEIGLTGDDLERADPVVDSTGVGWSISIQFNDRGSKIFSDLTRRIVGVDSKRIAIILDGEQLLAPVARAWIRDGRSEITGNFTREEVRTRSIQLDSGRLPVPLKIIQESDVDALLGAESLKRSLMAGMIGLGLVMIFMVAYYRMAGLVAAVSLVVYSLIVLAIFKMIPITLTLSHIGGFILSIGMAVDANVLIFERMKEEVRIGRTLASSMEVGFNRAWPAIRDGNVSTLITCIVLIWFGDRLGGGLITGFAISLMVGVLASMFTAVVVSRNLLQLLAWIGFGRRINLFTPERIRRAGDAAVGGS